MRRAAERDEAEITRLKTALLGTDRRCTDAEPVSAILTATDVQRSLLTDAEDARHDALSAVASLRDSVGLVAAQSPRWPSVPAASVYYCVQ